MQNDIAEDKESNPTSLVLRAREIIAKENISFCPRFSCFIIRSGLNIHSIQIFPKEKCSCPLNISCAHLLAIKLALGMPVVDAEKTKTINLTLLRKNARGRKKPGRKQPCPGDYNVEPAPDSKKALKRKSSWNSLPSPSDSQITVDMHTTDKPDSSSLSLSSSHESEVASKKHRPTADNNSNEVQPLISVSDTETRANVEQNVDNDMWLFNSSGVKLNLDKEDWGRLDDTHDSGWLNDKIIDAAHTVLRQEFQDIGGMQSCSLAERPSFRPESRPFVQIVNTNPRHYGSQLLSTVNCPPCTVNVYDSANSKHIFKHISPCTRIFVSLNY